MLLQRINKLKEKKYLQILGAVTKLLLLLVTAYGIYLAASPVLHHDMGYDTDIARDFLILQNTVTTHKLPLIGPRTGGIDGLFHGPLWPWINLPVFILSHGNPIATGWFWVFLIIVSLGITYYVGKKLFNDYVGLVAALILSFVHAGYSVFLLNPFGAVMLSPLFFYYFYRYIVSLKVRYLILSFFVTGLLIQFEVAFGGPVLILSIIYLLIFLYKKKKMQHMLSAAILIIPFSTYILFELRHNFLQFHAIINHIGAPAGDGKQTLLTMIQNRWEGMLKSILSIPYAPMWLIITIAFVFLYISIKSFITKDIKNRQFYLLFAYFYILYWPLSFYLNGYVLGFHVLPFVPVALIILASSYHLIRREIFIFLVVLAGYFNFVYAKGTVDGFISQIGIQPGSWTFNYDLAKTLYKTAPSEFGYYVYTPDEWGYGPKYALMYVSKEYPGKIALANTKKNITYAILAPNTQDNNGNWWVKNRVRILDNPVSVTKYSNAYEVRKYALDTAEIAVPSDPNLVKDLFFR